MLGLSKHNLCIGAVAAAYVVLFCHLHGCLYLKLVCAIVLNSLGGDILEVSLKLKVLQRTNGYLHRHACRHLPHFRLVNVATEDEVAHVGNGSYGCAVIERVGENHRVAHLYGDVKNDTCDGAAYERGAGTGVAARHTVAHNLKVILGSGFLLACLLHGLSHLVILICRHQTFVIEHLLAFMVCKGLFKIDFGKTQTRLCRTELRHIRDYLYLGYHLTSLHRLSCLFRYLRNDAADLRFDIYLVSRFYLSCEHRALAHVANGSLKLIILNRLWLRLKPQENECADKNKCHDTGNNYLFHIYDVFSCFGFLLVLVFLFWFSSYCCFLLLFPNHSSLIASTGFIDMALRAGAKPASTPSTLISNTAATAIQKSI